jgi:hypothetical protein
MFEDVDVDGVMRKIPAILPKLEKTPGRTNWAGVTAVGFHSREILQNILDMPESEIESLFEKGVVRTESVVHHK